MVQISGEICHATERRNYWKLCETIYNPPQLTTNAVLHGRAYEDDARKKFTEVTNLTVQKCGLHIAVDHPFLAATPDGLVGQSHVLEIKCPYKGRDNEIAPGNLFPFLEYNEGQLNLKLSHKYYDQIQAQMGITGRNDGYFVVYTFVDIKIIEVKFDEDYWGLSMIPKLISFYEKYYRTFISQRL